MNLPLVKFKKLSSKALLKHVFATNDILAQLPFVPVIDYKMIEKLETTEWMPAHTTPLAERVGPYQRRLGKEPPRWCWWNGEFFGTSGDTIEEARRFANYRSPVMIAPWRGITGRERFGKNKR